MESGYYESNYSVIYQLCIDPILNVLLTATLATSMGVVISNVKPWEIGCNFLPESKASGS